MDAPSSSSVATTLESAATAVVTAAVLVTIAVDWKIKKITTTKFFEGMVSSSFNIQYQSTGVDSLSSLDENKLKWSVQDLIECNEFDIIVV